MVHDERGETELGIIDFSGLERIAQIEEKLDTLLKLHTEEKYQALPEWIDLTTACELKGVNKKTIQNRPWLQPDLSKRERIGRKLMWHRDDVLEWLAQTDEELEATVAKSVATRQRNIGKQGELQTA